MGVAFNPNWAVAELLLDRGADVHAEDRFDNTPCNVAGWYVISITPHILDRLCVPTPAPTEAPARLWELRNETPLHRAVLDGDAEAVADLLDQGADINALATAYEPETGFILESATPLHLAALNNSDPEVVALLLDRGVDVNAKDDNDWTPLHYAVFNNPNPAVAELLLDRGAGINAKDDADSMFLHLAALNKSGPEMAVFLLDRGAGRQRQD